MRIALAKRPTVSTLALEQHFQQFLRERVYLHSIRPQTRDYYLTAWKAFQRAQEDVTPRGDGAPLLTRSDLQGFVIHLRERGVKAVSCNCWLHRNEFVRPFWVTTSMTAG